MTKLSILFCLTSMFWAATSEAPDTRAYQEAYAHVLEGRWDQADKAFAAMIDQYPNSGWVDDASFWRCYALSEQGQSEEASFKCFKAFVARWPGSQWTDDAHEAMAVLADSLAERGKTEYRGQLKTKDAGGNDRLLSILASLGEIGDEKSVDAILSSLEKAKDPVLRSKIVMVLEDVEHQRVTQTLLKLLAEDGNDVVRGGVISAMSNQMEQPGVAEALKKLVNNPNEPGQLRLRALENLADYQGAEILPMLEHLATTASDHDVARNAVHYMAEVDSKDRNAILTRLYEKLEHPELKRAVLETLGEVGDDHALSFLEKVAKTSKDEETRKHAVYALAESDNAGAIPILKQMLRDPSIKRDERIAILYGLGEREGGEGFLKEYIAKTTDKEDLMAAYEVLGDSENPELVPYLVEHLNKQKDPEIARHIMDVLGDMGGDAARDALIELLKNTGAK